MKDSVGILVILETDAGGLEPAAMALAGEAAAWSRTFEPALWVEALLFGEIEGAGGLLGPYGVNRLHQCVLDEKDYTPETSAYTASSLARKIGANWVFCLSSTAGTLSVPLMTAWLEAGLVSRCVGLDRNGADSFTALQPLHDGRLYQQLMLEPGRINVLAWEPSALGRWDPEGNTVAEAATIEPVPSPYAGRARPMKRIRGDFRTLPLTEADRIVAMGRGLAPDGLPLITQIAERLEASVGATRPVIDVGLLTFERQIGQTGVSVSPRLLLACGISGANEFTVGISDSRTVVAINTDPQARIFSLADLGLVGDALKVLEAFLKLVSMEMKSEKYIGGEDPS